METEPWKVQVSSLVALPFWYPFFGRMVEVRIDAWFGRDGSKPHAGKRKLAFWSQGPARWYRGVWATAALQPLYPYMFWSAKTLAYTLHLPPTSPLPVALGSLGISALANIADVTAIHMRRSPSKISVPAAMSQVYARHGWRGFFAGYVPMTLRTTPFAVGFISLRDAVHDRVRHNAATACITAAILQVATLPLDYYSILRQAFPGMNLTWRHVYSTVVAGRVNVFAGLGHRIAASAVEFYVFYEVLAALA